MTKDCTNKDRGTLKSCRQHRSRVLVDKVVLTFQICHAVNYTSMTLKEYVPNPSKNLVEGNLNLIEGRTGK